MSRYTAIVVLSLVFLLMVAVGIASADVTAKPINEAQGRAIDMRTVTQAEKDRIEALARAQANALEMAAWAKVQAEFTAALAQVVTVGGWVLSFVIACGGAGVSFALVIVLGRGSWSYTNAVALRAKLIHANHDTGRMPALVNDRKGMYKIIDIGTGQILFDNVDVSQPAGRLLVDQVRLMQNTYNRTRNISVNARAALPGPTINEIIKGVMTSGK